jgi:hypothetical protein
METGLSYEKALKIQGNIQSKGIELNSKCKAGNHNYETVGKDEIPNKEIFYSINVYEVGVCKDCGDINHKCVDIVAVELEGPTAKKYKALSNFD